MIKPNGTELYAQRVDIINKIVLNVDDLKIEHDRLIHLKSDTQKQGKIVSELRKTLNDAEHELSRLYKKKK